MWIDGLEIDKLRAGAVFRVDDYIFVLNKNKEYLKMQLHSQLHSLFHVDKSLIARTKMTKAGNVISQSTWKPRSASQLGTLSASQLKI